MKKKFIISTIILTIITLFTIPYAFAATKGMDNVVNGVRNFVGGTENVIENAGRDAADGIRSGINGVENGARDITNGIDNGAKDMTGSNNNGNGYTATRTSTDNANGMFSISNNVWTWLILAIVGIIIVAMIMYYAKQNNTTTYYNDDEDEKK